MITQRQQRRLYILAMIAASVSLLFAILAIAVAQPTSVTTFHDRSGFVTGKARKQDGVTTFYDRSGRVVGKAETRK